MFYIRLVLYFSRCALHTTANTFKWPFMACMQRREAINANWIESEWVAISRQDPKPSCLIKVFLQHHLCMCSSFVQGKVKKCQWIQENVIKSRLHWLRLSSLPSRAKIQQNRITKTIFNLRKKFRSPPQTSSLTEKERKLKKKSEISSVTIRGTFLLHFLTATQSDVFRLRSSNCHPLHTMWLFSHSSLSLECVLGYSVYRFQVM